MALLSLPGTRGGAVTSAHFFLAICQDCTPILPQPFYDEAERDKWAAAHREATGHRIVSAEERR
jgi:hypothetical protein